MFAGYASPLQSLETESLISKVHLLKSYDDMAYELKRLNLRSITFPGLFESKKLISFAGQTRGDGVATKVFATKIIAPVTVVGMPPVTPGKSKKELKKERKELAVAELGLGTPKRVSTPIIVSEPEEKEKTRGFTPVLSKKKVQLKQIDSKKASKKIFAAT
ncbi:hypothetical protein P7C70_g3580, partial [Phenoliferia sp. Uapishka_3]